MKIQNNNIPQGYKNSPLGVIPEEWEVKRLGEICKIFVGKDLKEDCFSESKNEKYPYGVYSNTVQNQGIYGYYNFVEYPENAVTVVGRGAGLGTAFPRHQGFGAIGRLLVLYSKLLDYRFLCEYINSRVNILVESAAIPQLTGEQMSTYKVLIPPLPEQHRIATLLSVWDTAIESQTQLVTALKTRKRALMQQLLTGKKRLPGFTEKWEKVKLGEILEESNELVVKSDVNKRITVRLNLQGIEKREVRGTEVTDATTQYRRYAGQFIYGKQNLHKGAFGIIPLELDGYESSQDIPSFNFTETVLPAYFMMFISQKDIYESLESISTGTGSKRIQPKNLFKMEYKFPNFLEQTAIASVLTTADKEIRIAETRLAQIRQQKKGLMQVLLTGKKRLII